MKKNVFIACRGLSFSGKSQWAKEKAKELGNTVIITKDDIRKEMGADLIKGIRVKESKVIEKRNKLIMEALEKGKNIISADTNFSIKINHIENMKALVFPKYRDQYEFLIKDFTDIPLDTLLERVSKTDRPEGKEYWKRVVLEQKKNWLPPIKVYENPNYYTRKDLSKCVIFDMDGTTTFLNGRNPYEDHLCFNDIPNYPTVDILKMYCERKDITVIILSGRREDTGREATENWLNANGINYDLLFMRQAGDTRRDSIIKREIYESLIKDNYLIYAVFDDRFQVVEELWREEGLPVFCCYGEKKVYQYFVAMARRRFTSILFWK